MCVKAQQRQRQRQQQPHHQPAKVRRSMHNSAASYNYHRIGCEDAGDKFGSRGCWLHMRCRVGFSKATPPGALSHTRMKEDSFSLSSVQCPRYLLPQQFSTTAIIFERTFRASILLLFFVVGFHFGGLPSHFLPKHREALLKIMKTLRSNAKHHTIFILRRCERFLAHTNGSLFTGE